MFPKAARQGYVLAEEETVADIPVSHRGNETKIVWKESPCGIGRGCPIAQLGRSHGEKLVYSDHYPDGSWGRLDVYYLGRGAADGPGHGHQWYVRDRAGNFVKDGEHPPTF